MIVRSTMETNGAVVLTLLVDSLDRVNAPEFRLEAGQAVATSSGPVVVDCGSLEFLDSSGLGAFLHVHNLLPEQRRPVRLTNVGTKVLTILELMQVHRIFELEPRKA
jgi:anti-sigma B factor antagonist